MYLGRMRLRSDGPVNRWLMDPPVWYRILGTIMMIIMVVGVWGRLGPWWGVESVVAFGAVAVMGAIVPDHGRQWQSRYRFLDSAVGGAALVACFAYLTRWPVWGCVTTGVALMAVRELRMWRRRRAAI